MKKTNLTIGDVLPATIQSHYSSAVLNVSLKEAIDIVQLGLPPSSNLSENAINSIHTIYELYLSTHAHDTESAYWNKPTEQNDAYWSSLGN